MFYLKAFVDFLHMGHLCILKRHILYNNTLFFMQCNIVSTYIKQVSTYIKQFKSRVADIMIFLSGVLDLHFQDQVDHLIWHFCCQPQWCQNFVKNLFKDSGNISTFFKHYPYFDLDLWCQNYPSKTFNSPLFSKTHADRLKKISRMVPDIFYVFTFS